MIKAKELKIYVETADEFRNKMAKELRAIDKGKAKSLKESSISFQSLGQLRAFLTPKRLELVKAIKHKKPGSIYELAKLIGRTPENVNSDIKLLEGLGLVEVTKTSEARKKSVPQVTYDKMSFEIAV